MTRAERERIAVRRIKNILGGQIVCNERTLEQKIADAGPNDQRVDPHILTIARTRLVAAGEVRIKPEGGAPWFHLSGAKDEVIKRRLDELVPIFSATQAGSFATRAGQALEIAIYRALEAAHHQFLGHFADLEEHGDETAYNKVETERIGARIMTKGPLDFLIFGDGGPGGIEAKNYRQWIYPQRSEVRKLLLKCVEIDAVPVLIARRLPFITFRVMNLSGGIVHQTYNQLYPQADQTLAAKARHKDLLGYHDIRIGNVPDARLLKFIVQLPKLVPAARASWDAFSDVHAAYANGKIAYKGWVREILTRSGVWRVKESGEQEFPEGVEVDENLEPPELS